MQRRQLLARVMTIGLVLVGAPRLPERQQTGISEAEVQLILKARDQAAATIAGPPYVVGEHGPAFFSGYLQPMGLSTSDYKWLAGVRWEVIPDAPMATWWQ